MLLAPPPRRPLSSSTPDRHTRTAAAKFHGERDILPAPSRTCTWCKSRKCADRLVRPASQERKTKMEHPHMDRANDPPTDTRSSSALPILLVHFGGNELLLPGCHTCRCSRIPRQSGSAYARRDLQVSGFRRHVADSTGGRATRRCTCIRTALGRMWRCGGRPPRRRRAPSTSTSTSRSRRSRRTEPSTTTAR